MIVTTTPSIEGKRIVHYYGIVSGETIIGANFVRDLFASVRDIFGGRSGSYEEVLREAKATALSEMQQEAERLGANAIVGVDLDYETVGSNFLFVGSRFPDQPDFEYVVAGQGRADTAHRYCLSCVDRNRRGGDGAFGHYLLSRTRLFLAPVFHRHVDHLDYRSEDVGIDSPDQTKKIITR